MTTQPVILSLQSPLAASDKQVRDWRLTMAKEICGLNIEPLKDGRIDIQARVGGLGDLVYAGWKSTPLLSSRDHETIRDGNDGFSLTFSQGRAHYFTQYEEETYSEKWQTRILRLSEPCSWGGAEQIEAVSIVIPVKILEDRIPNVADIIKRPVSLNEGAGRLLSDYNDLIGKHLDQSEDAMKRAMATHFIDLLVLALTPSSDAKELVRSGGLKSLRRAAILRHIQERLADPNLNLRDAAEKLGLSSRYVQLLLEENGTSFSKIVRAERIACASARLSDPRYDHMRVIDIAFATGFSDLSTFNRAFRNETGDTPANVRACRTSARGRSD
jgi:AraC-like DNA-binding protein